MHIVGLHLKDKKKAIHRTRVVPSTKMITWELYRTHISLKRVDFFSVPSGRRPSLPGRSTLQDGVEPEALRIAPINRVLRDIVDFVDLFPFSEPPSRKGREGCFCCFFLIRTNDQENRNALTGCFTSFVVYGKQRETLKIARFFKGLTLPPLSTWNFFIFRWGQYSMWRKSPHYWFYLLSEPLLSVNNFTMIRQAYS